MRRGRNGGRDEVLRRREDGGLMDVKTAVISLVEKETSMKLSDDIREDIIAIDEAFADAGVQTTSAINESISAKAESFLALMMAGNGLSGGRSRRGRSERDTGKNDIFTQLKDVKEEAISIVMEKLHNLSAATDKLDKIMKVLKDRANDDIVAELEKEGVKWSEITDASTAVKATDGLVDGIALLMGHQFVMSKYMAGAISLFDAIYSYDGRISEDDAVEIVELLGLDTAYSRTDDRTGRRENIRTSKEKARKEAEAYLDDLGVKSPRDLNDRERNKYESILDSWKTNGGESIAERRRSGDRSSRDNERRRGSISSRRERLFGKRDDRRKSQEEKDAEAYLDDLRVRSVDDLTDREYDEYMDILEGKDSRRDSRGSRRDNRDRDSRRGSSRRGSRSSRRDDRDRDDRDSRGSRRGSSRRGSRDSRRDDRDDRDSRRGSSRRDSRRGDRDRDDRDSRRGSSRRPSRDSRRDDRDDRDSRRGSSRRGRCLDIPEGIDRTADRMAEEYVSDLRVRSIDDLTDREYAYLMDILDGYDEYYPEEDDRSCTVPGGVYVLNM